MNQQHIQLLTLTKAIVTMHLERIYAKQNM